MLKCYAATCGFCVLCFAFPSSPFKARVGGYACLECCTVVVSRYRPSWLSVRCNSSSVNGLVKTPFTKPDFICSGSSVNPQPVTNTTGLFGNFDLDCFAKSQPEQSGIVKSVIST